MQTIRTPKLDGGFFFYTFKENLISWALLSDSGKTILFVFRIQIQIAYLTDTNTDQILNRYEHRSDINIYK